MESAKSGREVTILTRPREKLTGVLTNLLDAGARVLAYPLLHSKFLVVPEEERALIMTANVEERGLDTGYEIGVELKSTGASEMAEIALSWAKQAPLMWERGGSIEDMQPGQVRLNERRERPDLTIEESISTELPPLARGICTR